jgi:hypothetical protein
VWMVVERDYPFSVHDVRESMYLLAKEFLTCQFLIENRMVDG